MNCDLQGHLLSLETISNLTASQRPVTIGNAELLLSKAKRKSYTLADVGRVFMFMRMNPTLIPMGASDVHECIKLAKEQTKNEDLLSQDNMFYVTFLTKVPKEEDKKAFVGLLQKILKHDERELIAPALIIITPAQLPKNRRADCLGQLLRLRNKNLEPWTEQNFITVLETMGQVPSDTLENWVNHMLKLCGAEGWISMWTKPFHMTFLECVRFFEVFTRLRGNLEQALSLYDYKAAGKLEDILNALAQTRDDHKDTSQENSIN